jgi:hypothetical protein
MFTKGSLAKGMPAAQSKFHLLLAKELRKSEFQVLLEILLAQKRIWTLKLTASLRSVWSTVAATEVLFRVVWSREPVCFQQTLSSLQQMVPI